MITAADCLSWFLLLLGAAALGSFANVLVYRLPIQMMQSGCVSEGVEEAEGADAVKVFNIAVPVSHCPACQTPLKWWQNVPLVSFVLLKGRCAFCHEAIPRRYFWIELGAVLIAVACLSLFGIDVKALIVFVFLYALWVLSWIDALHQLLPDVLTLGLLWVGLLLRACWAPMTLADAVLGVALGYALLYLPSVLYLKWRGEVGLGLGDAKLLGAIGAWLGLVHVPTVLLLASVLGLLYGGAQFLARARSVGRTAAQSVSDVRRLRIAFGPFISLAAVLTMAWEHGLIFVGWRL